MIRSMTGYGRAQEQIDGKDIFVEVKSVNSRYLEQNVRIGRNTIVGRKNSENIELVWQDVRKGEK